MKDFEEEEEEEEEEKIRVEVGFFAHFFYQRESLKTRFRIGFFISLLLSLERRAFDATDASVSLYYSFRNGRQHCELGAWVKVESGETQKWFGRVRYVIF